MTTSGTITAAMTANEIVAAAGSMIGAIDPEETLSDTQAALGIRHLQWMLKSWQADGCNLWREYEDTQNFVTGSTEKTLDPFVIDVIEARLVLSSTNERPLARWEWGEWVTLPNKTTRGTPTVFTLRKMRDTISMRLWPVPSRAYAVRYTAARVIEDVTAGTQTLDIPQAWMECVFTNLARRLVSPFQVPMTPAVQEVMTRADGLYLQMRAMDRPASVFFARQ